MCGFVKTRKGEAEVSARVCRRGGLPPPDHLGWRMTGLQSDEGLVAPDS